MAHPIYEVDVFATTPFSGNPVAVVLEAGDLSTEEMARIANWTNYSETTFVLPPTDPRADYRVRIFTPVEELPFAGHPTLGTCHAWLEAGGQPVTAGQVVQECAVGLVELRAGDHLAFRAPPLLRSGAPDPEELDEVCRALQIEAPAIVRAAWVDNGPGWVAVELGTVEEVLAVKPLASELKIGVVARPSAARAAADLEVRAFFRKDGAMVEDPVTGSLNASVAIWLLGEGVLQAPYSARQGTALGRAGRVEVTQDPDGAIWVGGSTFTRVRGTIHV
jgi:PhzF family phenazine biosynthesis protein